MSEQLNGVNDIMNRIKHKIVFLGNSNVGKTSVIERYNFDIFDEKNQPTIGLDFVGKTIKVEDRFIKLLLWDTAGQERFQSLIPSYIRDASCAIIVFDLTNRKTFDCVEVWYQHVKNTRADEALIVLIGNKTDLPEQRVVTTTEAEEFAKERGILYFEVSAKTGVGISQAFDKLCLALPHETSLLVTQSQCVNQSQIEPLNVNKIQPVQENNQNLQLTNPSPKKANKSNSCC